MTTLRDLRGDELVAAAAVLARASRDAPLAAAVLHEQRLREQYLRRVSAVLLGGAHERIGACEGGAIVGVAVLARPGACHRLWLGMTPPALLPSLGARRWSRLVAWRQALRIHDLMGPHVHVDPLALDADFPDVGGLLLGEVARRLDATGQIGYVATCRADRVGLHERHGFTVTWQTTVFGAATWFLRRDPLAAPH